MPKRKEKKEEKEKSDKILLPKKYIYLIRSIFGLLALAIFFIYGIYYHGFNNLWNDLLSATSVLKYILIFFIIFILILILLNIHHKRVQNDEELEAIAKNELPNNNDLEYINDLKEINSTKNGLKYLVLFVLFIFGLLVFCSLIKFLLPLIIIYLILIILYFILVKIITYVFKKKSIVKKN